MEIIFTVIGFVFVVIIITVLAALLATFWWLFNKIIGFILESCIGCLTAVFIIFILIGCLIVII